MDLCDCHMRDAILVEEWVNLQARLPHMPGMSRMIPVKRMIEFVSSCLQAALVSHSSPKNKGQGNATDCVDSEHKGPGPLTTATVRLPVNTRFVALPRDFASF